VGDLLALPFAQWLGFLSFVLGIAAFNQKNDRHLKILMLIFNLNHMLHFFLLGSIISSLSTLLSACRTATAIHTSSKYVALGFVLLSLSMGFYLFNSYWDLLPITGSIVGTVTVFLLTGIHMRIGFLIGACFWLANNIVIGSIGGVMLESTLIFVNLSTIYRLHRQAKVGAFI